MIITIRQKEDEKKTEDGRAQELCESRGGRPGLPVLDKPHGFCGRKATLNQSSLCRLGKRIELPVGIFGGTGSNIFWQRT